MIILYFTTKTIIGNNLTFYWRIKRREDPRKFFSSVLRCIVSLIFVDNKFTLQAKCDESLWRDETKNARRDLLKRWRAYSFNVKFPSKDNCIINLPTRCYKCQSIASPMLYLFLQCLTKVTNWNLVLLSMDFFLWEKKKQI